jgi:hypothetical protein
MKERRSSNDTNGRCPQCFAKKQTARHLHFLKFPDEFSLAGHLKAHLDEKAELDGTIQAITAWVRTIKRLYGDMVDENGVRLAVWQA